MLSGRTDKPDGANGAAMRQYIYMAFILRLFSRAPDSVLDQLHDRMVAAVKSNPERFPIDVLREFMSQRLKLEYRLQDHHLADDADLMLNIADGGVLQLDPADPNRHPKDLKLEVDHIFPRKKLEDAGLRSDADHIGNYRLVVMPANRRKLAKMPDESTAFFGRHQPELEAAYRRAYANLNRESFLDSRHACEAHP